MASKRGVDGREEWYNMGYMTPLHPDAFLCWSVKLKPRGAEECKVCQGRGGWNLRLNVSNSTYPLYQHMRHKCKNCNGVGYILSMYEEV